MGSRSQLANSPPHRGAPTSEARTQPADREEAVLIQRLRAGDHDAFDQIYRRHVSMVYRQAVRLMGNDAEAEEVAQEVFLAIYQKAKTFRGESAFSTWIYRLTVNMALTRLRRRGRREEVSFDDHLPRFQEDGHHQVRPVADWSHEVDAPLAQKEVRRILQQAIDQLSPLDKAVVVQSDLDGVANREIGENLGLSVPAVKARLHRARLFLRGRVAVHLGHSPT